MNLSAEEYLLILQMRNDSSLTLSTAEENYIKGLRLEGKTSFPMLKPKREKWHTYLNYIFNVKKTLTEAGQDATEANACYENAKNLKLGGIDLATYQSNISALSLSDSDPNKLKYMTSQMASEYQKASASEDTVLTLEDTVLPDPE